MTEKPNIVFILADQFRSDCLSVTGHQVVRTPNLDQLAHKGVVFRNAYTSCPSCIAARASIFTGLSPTSHGRLGYRDRVPWNYRNMLAGVLRDNGYQTHCVGKTHFFPQRKHCGFEGLESYEAWQNHDGAYVNDYWEWLREQTNGRLHEGNHGLQSNSWNARPSPLPEELHNNSWVATRGLDFLRRRDRTRPFFLNLSFHRPHPPIDPPQSYWDMYRDAELPPAPAGEWAAADAVPVTDLNTGIGVLEPVMLERCRRAYYAQVAHIDCQIGRVMNVIGRYGPENTIFIFTSDHGEMLGDHHRFRKSLPYEGSAGVPLIISGLDSGRNLHCRAPVVLEDLYPAMLEAAGIPLPHPVDGLSLLPLCRGETLSRDHIHSEHSGGRGIGHQMLTDGREKYIWFTRSGREQLFNLEEDPLELCDLAAGRHERVAFWREKLIERLAAREQDGLVKDGNLNHGAGTESARAPACQVD